jgi:formate hydrogenlyase subunit 4
MTMIDAIIHICILVALPPIMPGLIGKTKALFAGRRGAPILQPWYDIAKLARKGFRISGTTTWVFVLGPFVTLAAVFAAGLLLPFGSAPALVSFEGDMVLFAYLLGLARFFTTSAALDTGSAFEGMGSSREATFAFLTEPALFLAFIVLARESGSLSLASMLRAPAGIWSGPAAIALALVGIGLFMVLLAEGSRIPVDDPTTHLELTMIHEAMVLDHGGPFLGAIEYSSSMKLLVLGTVFIRVVLPFQTGSAWGDLGLFLAELAALSVAIGVVESVMARYRMRKVPWFLTGAILCCGGALILYVR